MRRIPRVGCNERATRPAAPSASRPAGLRRIWGWPALLIGPGSHGYRRCARALASAKFDSNADDVSISTVSWARRSLFLPDLRRQSSFCAEGRRLLEVRRFL